MILDGWDDPEDRLASYWFYGISPPLGSAGPVLRASMWMCSLQFRLEGIRAWVWVCVMVWLRVFMVWYRFMGGGFLWVT